MAGYKISYNNMKENMKINIILITSFIVDKLKSDFNSKIYDIKKTKYIINSNEEMSGNITTSLKSLPSTINDLMLSSTFDVIVALIEPLSFEQDFDNKIREIYNEKFPEYDGVLLLQNEDESITIPVIGKNYIKEFGYIYNPIYSTEVAEKEFLDVLKLKQKYVIIKDILFDRLELVRDDDKVYELRKKFNFGIFNLDKLRNKKRKKSSQNSIFNTLVDETYIINLERRKDRMSHMSLEMKRLGIPYKRFDAIDGEKLEEKTIINKSTVATIRSHIGVIKNASKNGYNKIAVFEDDIIFCDDFESRFKYYLENIPTDWDIMYLGCHFNACADPILLKNNVYKIKESYGCFSMILNNQNGIFQKIINNVIETMPYDDYIKVLQKELNCYVFMPFFVKTLKTVSDLSESKEAFEYEVVNKHFTQTFDPNSKPTVVIPPPTPPPVKMKLEDTVPAFSNQYTCEDYLRGKVPFVIFFNGRLIFDSQTTDKSNLTFEYNHFTLYGKVFPYQGMMIKRK